MPYLPRYVRFAIHLVQGLRSFVKGPGKAKTKKELLKYDVVITTYQTMALEWPDVEAQQKAKSKKKRSGDDFIQTDSEDERKKKKKKKEGKPYSSRTVPVYC